MSEIFKVPSILALDLGTTFGWAYCSMGRDGIYHEEEIEVGSRLLATSAEVTEWGKTRMTRRNDPRVGRFYDWLFDKLVTLPIDIVVFEDVQFQTFTYQTQLWASLRAALWLAAYKSDVVTDCLPVGTLKRFAGGGGLNKEGMAKAAVSCRFQMHSKGIFDSQKNCILDDNAVDALWLWRWAHLNLRRMLVKV